MQMSSTRLCLLGVKACLLQVCQPNGEVIITNDGATILKQMQLTQPAAKMLVELSKSQVCVLAWEPTNQLLKALFAQCAGFGPKLSDLSLSKHPVSGDKSSPLQGGRNDRIQDSKSTLYCTQDVVAGDGTTSVTVICGALLKKCLELLERGIHATVVSDAFAKAAQKAIEVSLPDCRMLTRLSSPEATETQPRVYCLLQVLQDMASPVDLDDREALIKAATT